MLRTFFSLAAIALLLTSCKVSERELREKTQQAEKLHWDAVARSAGDCCASGILWEENWLLDRETAKAKLVHCRLHITKLTLSLDVAKPKNFILRNCRGLHQAQQKAWREHEREVEQPPSPLSGGTAIGEGRALPRLVQIIEIINKQVILGIGTAKRALSRTPDLGSRE